MSSISARASLVTLLVLGTANAAAGSPFTRVEGLNSFGLFSQTNAGATTFGNHAEQGVADYGRNSIEGADFLSQISSYWSDVFTVTGGTIGSTGSITFNFSLDGSLTMPLQSCGMLCGSRNADSDYNVSFVYRELFGTPSIVESGNLTYLANRTQNFSFTGSVTVPFTYGTPFVGGFELVGFTGQGGGSFDFFHTGLVTGVVLPTGATLSAQSGTVFAALNADPVPEPASLVLLAGGLAIVAAVVRRRVSASGRK